MGRIGIWMVATILIVAAGCGQQDRRGGDDTPLLVDEQNLQQFGVNDLRQLDWKDMHSNTRMEASEQLGRLIKQRERISDAVVILTDHHAYVGIKPLAKDEQGGEIPNSLRARISLALKTADSKLIRVYVSGHPDVYRTLKSYSSKLKHGVSERSLVQSFNTRMQTFFPFHELGR